MTDDSVLPITEFTWFSQQIAGHGLHDINNGILQHKHNTQHIYKPYNTTEHGFYTALQHHSQLQHLLPYVSQYHGVQLIQHDDGTVKQYLRLSNVLTPYTAPCIADIKIGAKTYHKHAAQCKIYSETSKFTYQELYGFRLTGMQVYDTALQQYRHYDKYYGRSITPDTMVQSLGQLFNTAQHSAHHSQHVVDVLKQWIARLQALVHVFETQLQYHEFVSSSVLLVYDSDLHSTVAAKVYMIDFCHYSHSVEHNTERDTNYIHGVRSLTTQLEQLLHLYQHSSN